MSKIITLQLEIDDDGNVKVLSQKKETKQTKKKVQDETLADVVVRKGSIILSDKLIDAIGASIGDKIDIKYELQENKPIPIIATSETWNDPEGNKLTKAKTIRLGKEDSLALNVMASELMIDKVVGKRCYLKVYTKPEPVVLSTKSPFTI